MFRRTFLAAVAALAILAPGGGPASAASQAEINAGADAALAKLIASQPVSEEMLANAAGLLIFPEIVKGGLLVGGSTGDGVLRVNGAPAGYYNTSSLSFGLQAGIATYGYVMVFNDAESLAFLEQSSGWEVGVGPNVTVADEGYAARLSSTTAQSGIVVFFVNQEGFFAGAGLEGAKITKISD